MNKHIVSMSAAVLAMMPSWHCYAQPGPIEAGENIAVASTEYGRVRGYIDDGVFALKGIPYARADRFMPPQVPEKWEGVRQYTVFGPQAMQGKAQNWKGQSDANFGLQFNIEPMDEKESLVLNIWSRGIGDGGKRPVWVWIHGGGFAAGSANQLPFFDGRSLADKGDIVVVTVNHRLNLLGYVDLRGLGGKNSESVNLGQQDLVAALRWIRDNIENFGGDPAAVTIDGQSGGGGKVSTLLAMPSAAGLFHRAIIQSGSLAFEMKGEDSKAFGLAFAAVPGVTPKNPERLNDFSYDELVEAGNVASDKLGPEGSSIMGRYRPTVDGEYLPQNPLNDPPAEFSKNVAILLGPNLNEFTYADRAIITPMTMKEVRSKLAKRYGPENVDAIIGLFRKAYRKTNSPSTLRPLILFSELAPSGRQQQDGWWRGCLPIGRKDQFSLDQLCEDRKPE